MKKIFLYTILVFLLPNLSIAFNKKEKNNFTTCIPTKIFFDDYEPKNFPPTNDLTRASAYKSETKGKIIILNGKLLDKDCVPIANAKIYLWQKGIDGKYHYELLRSNLGQEYKKSLFDTFIGAGTAVTDNEGNFKFITISPLSTKGDSANFNIRVSHVSLGQLQTKIYMKDISLTNNIFTIVMPGIVPNKRY